MSEMCYIGKLLCVLKFHCDLVSAKVICQSQVYIRGQCFPKGAIFDVILAKSNILLPFLAISAEVCVSRDACNF